jgi:hypothetical protein
MLTVIWGVDGFLAVNVMTSQHSFNSQYFVSKVMTPMITKEFPHGKISHWYRVYLHLDNCCVHFSKVSEFSSPKTSFCMYRTRLTVTILHRQAFWPCQNFDRE